MQYFVMFICAYCMPEWSRDNISLVGRLEIFAFVDQNPFMFSHALLIDEFRECVNSRFLHYLCGQRLGGAIVVSYLAQVPMLSFR